MAQAKFRPSFTIAEINYILDVVAADNREATSRLRDNVHKQLQVFSLKARIGAVSASHTSKAAERISIEDALDDSPAQRREKSYQLWCMNPALCTPQQISLAKTYRYENNLMSPDEEEEYESSI